MRTIPLRLDGYTDLPPGKLANVVTYLEMTGPPDGPPEPLPAGLSVRLAADPDPEEYRALVKAVGEPWLWVAIPLMPADALAALVRDPMVDIHVMSRDGAPIGVAELDRRRPEEPEIAIFGVVPAAIGSGAAHHLMQAVIRSAFAKGARRLWLHTCTHDHPGALRFYRRAGFRPYKLAVEVMDDPRLSGDLPETAAPHVALIRPAP